MINNIVVGEYIDFNEVPPARDLSPTLSGRASHHCSGRGFDSVKEIKISNFKTWSQCFSLFAAIFTHDPFRAGDLMAYNHSITAMAKKCKWPSWTIYEGRVSRRGEEDTGTYAKCFNWGPVLDIPIG